MEALRQRFESAVVDAVAFVDDIEVSMCLTIADIFFLFVRLNVHV